MTRTIQLVRGTTAQNNAFTGAAGELSVDTTINELRVHDGSTAGGHPVAKNDLSNLTAAGANIANWSHNISNCIIEIPQDIKLELNNGTLTLKAGSKVYVPNGAGNFDVITIANDLTTTNAEDGARFVVINPAGTSLSSNLISSTSSGTIPPSGSGLFYNTSTNSINYYNSGVIGGQGSFPIAIIIVSGGAISSIDQVFNGFGYIGSTVFTLPGVSVLAPDGRNSDGSLKTYAYTVSSVMRRTDTTNGTQLIAINCNNNTYGVGAYIYNEITNYNYVNNAISDKRCIVASMTITSGVVSDLTVKTPFHAVDYNDTEFIAHQSAPSARYMGLTLPASGGTITAPADGYIYVNKVSGATSERIVLGVNNNFEVSKESVAASEYVRISLYVSKGSVITITYTLTGSTNTCRFIYANGAK